MQEHLPKQPTQDHKLEHAAILGLLDSTESLEAILNEIWACWINVNTSLAKGPRTYAAPKYQKQEEIRILVNKIRKDLRSKRDELINSDSNGTWKLPHENTSVGLTKLNILNWQVEPHGSLHGPLATSRSLDTGEEICTTCGSLVSHTLTPQEPI